MFRDVDTESITEWWMSDDRDSHSAEIDSNGVLTAASRVEFRSESHGRYVAGRSNVHGLR